MRSTRTEALGRILSTLRAGSLIRYDISEASLAKTINRMLDDEGEIETTEIAALLEYHEKGGL